MDRARRLVCAVVALLIFGSAAAAAPVDLHLPFSFASTQAAGRRYTYVFALFDREAVGTGDLVWSETTPYVLPRSKRITHLLGTVAPFSNAGTTLAPVDFSRQLWVEVRSGTRVIGGKRTKLAVVPYALWSAASDAVPIQQYLDAGMLAAGGHSHEHGLLAGLGADDHPQYFDLAQNEVVAGRPAFDGGASGVTPPFTVSSDTVVANLNADLLDGKHAAELGGGGGVTDHGALAGLGDDDHPQYFELSQDEVVAGRPAFSGGESGVTPPFTVDSATVVPNLNADLFDGRQRWSPYERVAVVSLDADAPGYRDPALAMAQVETWCGVPAYYHRCLLRIMPGFYTLPQPLQIAAYVDVEGSGVKTTTLYGAIGDDGLEPRTGLVVVNGDAELRHLTVWNQYGGGQNVGILKLGADVTISDVEVVVDGGAAARGMYSPGGSAIIKASRFTAHGGTGAATAVGIDNDFAAMVQLVDVFALGASAENGVGIRNVNYSQATLRNVSAIANGRATATGIENDHATLDFSDVSVEAGGASNARGIAVTSCDDMALRGIRAFVYQSDAATGIAVSGGYGTIMNAEVTVHGKATGAGITVGDGARPVIADAIVDVQALTGAASRAIGILNASASRTTLRSVVATADGQGGSWGILTDNAWTTMTNVSALASGTWVNVTRHGLSLASSGCGAPPCYTTTADNCSFSAVAAQGTGVSRSVSVAAGHRLRMGASALTGALANDGGVCQCVFTYDADTYTPASCP